MSEKVDMTENGAHDTTSPFLFSYLLGTNGRGTTMDADAIRNWKPDDGPLWLHLDITDENACRWIEQQGDLPATVKDTLLAGDTRPRSQFTQHGLLIILRGVNTNPGENPEDMVSVRVWIEPHRIISTRRRRLLSVVDIAGSLETGDGPDTPSAFLARLVDRLAERIGDFVDSIETRLDTIEDEIGKASSNSIRLRLSPLRRQMASVRRFLAPQRDALDRLYRQPVEFINEKDANLMREESDRITRYLEDLELARERAVVLQEELLSHMAQEQNSRMYVLSVVAAIFLPLTFITGLLGMNVGGLPGVDSNAGFTGSIVLMVVSAIGLLGFFRWKKWL